MRKKKGLSEVSLMELKTQTNRVIPADGSAKMALSRPGTRDRRNANAKRQRKTRPNSNQ